MNKISLYINLFAICFYCIFAFSGCTSTVDPEPPLEPTPRIIKVATWNVHNFFDTICDTNDCTVSSYEPPVSMNSYNNKVKTVAQGIKKLDADIVLLQEIEKEENIKDLLFGLPEYKHYVFGETGKPASVDVAIISKYPIISTKMHRDDHWFVLEDGSNRQLARELVQAEVEVDSQIQITAFVTHFISKASDPDAIRRVHEAEITAEILHQYVIENPNALVIFGGDLNDYPNSESIEFLDRNSSLSNTSIGTLSEKQFSWRNQARFDYLFQSDSLKQYLSTTEIRCDERSGTYFESDHCAVISIYKF